MRIIGGTAGGRILKVPSGFDVRPTPDLVRQALFNSLGERVAGTRVLELFAGTGALSLECLSRGATKALCIEKSSRHARFIRDNLVITSLSTALLDIRVQDAFAAIHQLAVANQQFDLILADPPYGEKNIGHRSHSYAQKLLDHSDFRRLFHPDTLFVLGHTRRDTLSVPAGWLEEKVLKHGDSHLRLLRWTGAE